MQKFNLLDYDTKDSVSILILFQNETFLDNQDNIVEAYITVHPFTLTTNKHLRL